MAEGERIDPRKRWAQPTSEQAEHDAKVIARAEQLAKHAFDPETKAKMEKVTAFFEAGVRHLDPEPLRSRFVNATEFAPMLSADAIASQEEKAKLAKRVHQEKVANKYLESGIVPHEIPENKRELFISAWNKAKPAESSAGS